LRPTDGQTEHEACSEYEREIEHASFQNRHNIFLSLGALPIVAAFAHGVRGVSLGMSGIHPECPQSRPSDRLPADVLLREEPDDEDDEEEDEGDGKEDDDDDTTDDGYSE
jgi:hypothetical protein